MKHLLLLSLLATAQVSYGQAVESSTPVISVEKFNTLRVKPGAAYQHSFPVRVNQPTALKIQVRNRVSMGSILKAGTPLVAATAYSLFKQSKSATYIEGTQPQSSVVPYLVGGALASGATINLIPRRKRAYLELVYRNQIGILQRTEGHWINLGKPVVIDVNASSDGWVDVIVTAPPKHGLRIQQLDLVPNPTNILFDKPSRFQLVGDALSNDTINSSTADHRRRSIISLDHSGDKTENGNIQHLFREGIIQANSLGSGSGTESEDPKTHQVPASDCPDCPPPIDGGWLPELVVVGHYSGDGGGSTGQNWSGFIANFQYNLPGSTTFYTTGGSSYDGSNTYINQMPSPPDRSLIATRGMRRASFCNSINDLWDWSYGGNNTNNTVEQAAFILGDGTMLMLPTQDPSGGTNHNTYNQCFYRIGDSFLDYTGSITYSIGVPTGGPYAGSIVVNTHNHVTGKDQDLVVIGYVHTHPYTGPDQNGAIYDIYNPTSSFDYGPPGNVGDWGLSKDYNIPGYIVTQNKVVTYYYNQGLSGDAKKQVTGRPDHSDACSPEQ